MAAAEPLLPAAKKTLIARERDAAGRSPADLVVFGETSASVTLSRRVLF